MGEQTYSAPVVCLVEFPCKRLLPRPPANGTVLRLDPNAAHAMSGFVANPMERAEASKVALYGVADYAWNMKAYNPESDFVEACRYVLPEAPEAFRTSARTTVIPGQTDTVTAATNPSAMPNLPKHSSMTSASTTIMQMPLTG